MTKNENDGTWKTYFIWMTFGYMGGHHFYLGRDVHAFLWLTTFGGFHVGLIRDSWRIKEYVKDANGERQQTQSLTQICSLSMFLGQMLISTWYYYIFHNFPSEDEENWAKPYLSPLGLDLYKLCGIVGQALGIYLTGCTGRMESNFWIILLAVVIGNSINYFGLGFIFGFITFYRYAKCVPYQPTRTPILWRWLKLCFFTLLFWTAVIRSIYVHGQIGIHDPLTSEMKQTKIKDILMDAIHSRFCQELIQEVRRFWKESHGWKDWWYILRNSQHPNHIFLSEEHKAFRELDMDGCTISKNECDYSHVKQKFYQLSKLYHPDKMAEKDSAYANEKMLKLNSAYETLSTLLKGQ